MFQTTGLIEIGLTPSAPCNQVEPGNYMALTSPALSRKSQRRISPNRLYDLSKGMSNVILEGYIIVSDEEIESVMNELQIHIELTRQEVGCILFEVVRDDENKNRFKVKEEFINAEAFKEPLTWTPPVCQVNSEKEDRLQSYIRPVCGGCPPGLNGIRRRGPI